MLNPKFLRLFYAAGLEYMAFIFSVNLLYKPLRMQPPQLNQILPYLPFAALAVLGPLLRWSAVVRSWRKQQVAAMSAGSPNRREQGPPSLHFWFRRQGRALAFVLKRSARPMLCPRSSCWSFPLARRPPRVGLEHLTIGWFMAALRRSPSSPVSRSVVVKSLFSYLAIWSEEPRLIDHCAFDKLGATRSLPSKSAHMMLLLMWFFRSYPANPQLHCERLYQLMRRFGRSQYRAQVGQC
jgi:hypothetical protein